MATNHENLRLNDQRAIWDAEYKAKGRMWGNVPLEPTIQSSDGIFLDLGCGDGKNLRRKTGENLRIGLDFSIAALHLCRNNPELTDTSFICADVRYLPFKDNTIHSSDAHHLHGHLNMADRIKAAREISRILHKNGELILTVFSSGDLREGKGEMVEPGTYRKGTGIITHYFTYEEMDEQFPELNCQSIEPISWDLLVKGNRFPRVMWSVRYKKSI